MSRKTVVLFFVAGALFYLLSRKKKEKPVYYTVKKGDTLSKIAQQFGTDWKTLAKLNNLKNPNLIRVNQLIRIK